MRYAVYQHLRALEGGPNEVLYHNAIAPPPAWLRLSAPDYVVLHPTFLGVRWNDDFEQYRSRYSWLANFTCPKLALPQDEYDHSDVLEHWLLELGATHVFSCFGREARAPIYRRLDGRLPFSETLTGYIDEAAVHASAHALPAAQRAHDIVYRASQLPYWFGSHGQLKHRLASLIGGPARERGLRTDISTDWADTIYGSAWIDFLCSGRTTIGAESGSSVLDRTGEIQARIRSLLADEPTLTFEDVDRQMPAGWDAYAFFAISPRHLEAVVTKTCQVLIEGTYSGVLVPDRHYIPLRRNLENLDAALDRISDVDACVEIAETAYREIYLEGGYTTARLAADLREAAGSAGRRRRAQLPLSILRRLERPQQVQALGSSTRAIRTNIEPFVWAWATIAETLSRHADLRRVLLRRRGATRRRLLGDILRVAAAERAWGAGTIDGDPRWWLSAQVDGDTLRLTSEVGPLDAERRRIDQAYSRIVWDHRAISAPAPLFPSDPARAVVDLGETHRYEFSALAAAGVHTDLFFPNDR